MTMQRAHEASSERKLASSYDSITSSSTNEKSGVRGEADVSRPSVVRRVDRWLRERSLLLLAIAVVTGFSWPEHASRVLSHPRLVELPLGYAYDARTLALAVIVLSASLRCTPRDFTRVFASKGGFANLLTIYLVVPALTLAVAYGTLHFGGESFRGVALGLVLSVIVPVAMTSAVWTRASQGSVPLALGTLAVTSVLAAFLVPQALGRLAGLPGIEMGASLSSIRAQVVLAFAVPLVIGSITRAGTPRVANAIEPLFSIASIIALFAFVGDSASALRPHLSTHKGVLAVALVLTVFTNALSYTIGYFVARMRGLDEQETIAVVFGSGMRSVPAALAIGAIAFPGVALVGLPPVLWSVTQQLLAGVLSSRFLRSRDLAEPVLPLKRRVVDAAVRVASVSRPALAELEDSIVLPLRREFEDTLVYRPRKQSAPSTPG